MDITRSLPTADLVLQFEPKELAFYLLDHLNGDRDRLNIKNLIGASIRAHYKNDEHVERALLEAWAWLAREGLLVETPGLPRWFFISRRGHRVLGRQDFDEFRRFNILLKDLELPATSSTP